MSSTKDTEHHIIPVSLRGRTVNVAARSRPGRGPGAELVLFLHGFGCTNKSFAAAFDDASLADLALCAIDLPGHGGTPALERSHDLLCDYSIIVRRVVAHFNPERVHLVCHSMGGAVGVLAAPDLPLGALVSIEGNLVAGDCGLISRRIAGQDRGEFTATGYEATFGPLRSSQRPDERAWGDWAATCDPAALHEAARSLVSWCDGGDLADIYRSLPTAVYVYGQRNGLPEHLAPVVDPEAAFGVADSGHFPMIDNGPLLWPEVAEHLSRGDGAADR
ncbi:alpha/beta hydrolase [Glycomyces sp. NPDC047369]